MTFHTVLSYYRPFTFGSPFRLSQLLRIPNPRQCFQCRFLHGGKTRRYIINFLYFPLYLFLHLRVLPPAPAYPNVLKGIPPEHAGSVSHGVSARISGLFAPFSLGSLVVSGLMSGVWIVVVVGVCVLLFEGSGGEAFLPVFLEGEEGDGQGDDG